MLSLYAVAATADCGVRKTPASGTGGTVLGAGGFDAGASAGQGVGVGGVAGSAGTPDVPATGGTAGTGFGGGAVSSGGVAGAATAGGAGGAGGEGGTIGPGLCEEICVFGSRRCAGGGIETCTLTSSGCPVWANGGFCCPAATCIEAASFCECNPFWQDLHFKMEGSVCGIPGASVFWEYTRTPPGCWELVGPFPCAAGRTCDATDVVPTGTACGCPAPGDTAGTGCTTVDDTIPLFCNANLRCEARGDCLVWRF